VYRQTPPPPPPRLAPVPTALITTNPPRAETTTGPTRTVPARSTAPRRRRRRRRGRSQVSRPHSTTAQMTNDHNNPTSQASKDKRHHQDLTRKTPKNENQVSRHTVASLGYAAVPPARRVHRRGSRLHTCCLSLIRCSSPGNRSHQLLCGRWLWLSYDCGPGGCHERSKRPIAIGADAGDIQL
jgi:hypothetical protein